MTKSQGKLLGIIAKLPSTPGVYRFIGSKRRILYIGKATNLKSRVKSYFSPDIGEKRSELIRKMVSESTNIKFEKTESVLEALILEAELIKKHLPYYNSMGKDQRSWNYVVITKEKWPRVLVMREREINQTPPPNPLPLIRGGGTTLINHKFGPFTNGSQLKEAMKIVRRIFPYRDRCVPASKPCFNYQIGLCPGVCAGAISEKEYKKTIKNITLFFMGKKKILIKKLEKEMKQLARKREFEKADDTKKKIFALQHIHDIALIKKDRPELQTLDHNLKPFRIEAYDIAHISGTNMVGVMTVVENGEAKKSDYRMFKIRGQKGADDTRALVEVIERRFKHLEWRFPDLVVVDGGIAQLNAVTQVLKNGRMEEWKNIEIVAVTKDEKHKAKEILNIERLKYGKFEKLKLEDLKKQIIIANSESHRFAINFHRKLRDRVNRV